MRLYVRRYADVGYETKQKHKTAYGDVSAYKTRAYIHTSNATKTERTFFISVRNRDVRRSARVTGEKLRDVRKLTTDAFPDNERKNWRRVIVTGNKS